MKEIKKLIQKHTDKILRLSIAPVFLYFGVQAVLDPATQFQTWVHPSMQFIPQEGMIIFGLIEIGIAISFLTGKWTQKFGVISAIAFLGILPNLFLFGMHSLLLRDIVLLAVSIVIVSKEN